jgi:hypothetical protein
VGAFVIFGGTGNRDTHRNTRKISTERKKSIEDTKGKATIS